MNIPAHPTLIRAMCNARVNKLRAACPVLAASLVTIQKTCGRPGCHCQQGEKHVGHYLTYKHKRTTRTVYVPRTCVRRSKHGSRSIVGCADCPRRCRSWRWRWSGHT